MGQFTTIQNSFAYGELSEKMASRTDLEFYKHGALIIENMEILPEGGLSKRNGFELCGSVTSDVIGKQSKLIPFTPPSGGTFFLNFSNTAVTLIEKENGIYGASTKLNNRVLPYGGYPTDYLQVGDLLFITWPYYEPIVAYFAEGKVNIIEYSKYENADYSYLGTPMNYSVVDKGVEIAATTSGSTGLNTLTATKNSFPYPIFKSNEVLSAGYRGIGSITLHHIESSANYVFKSSFHRVQSFGITYTASLDVDNKTLVGLAGNIPTDGTYVRVTGTTTDTRHYAYIKRVTSLSYRCYPSWEDAKNATNAITFNSSDATQSVRILGVTTASVITEIEAPDTLPVNSYSLSYWGSVYGFPTVVSIMDGRLIFSGIAGKAGVALISSSYNLFRLNPEKLRQDDQEFYKTNTVAEDESGLNYFGADSINDPWDIFLCGNSIRNVKWIKSLDTVSVVGTDTDEILASLQYTDTSIGVKTTVISNYGSSKSLSYSVANSVYFMSRFNQLIQILNTTDGFKVNNLSALNSEIIPFSVNELYFNTEKQTLYISPNYADIVNEEPYFVCYSISRSTGVSGFYKIKIPLLWLTGENIQDSIIGMFIVGDEPVLCYYQKTISPSSYALYFASFGDEWIDFTDRSYKAKVVSLPLDLGNPYGSSLGQFKRIHEITAKLYKTKYCKYGSNEADLEEMVLDSNVEFTGEKKVNFPASPDTTAYVIIESEENLPLTILGIVYKGEMV